MELLSLNEIRSLGHRAPPSQSLQTFVQAVLNQAIAWAQRVHVPVKSYEPNWRQIEAQWDTLRQSQGEHGATVALARYVEAGLQPPAAQQSVSW